METREVDAVQAKVADPRTFALWAGVLAPPTAFLADLALSYVLANRSCAGGRGWLNAVAVAALAVIVVSAWLAWRADPAEPTQPADAGRPAQRLLRQVAVWSSMLFAVAVIALALPRLFLDPCAQY